MERCHPEIEKGLSESTFDQERIFVFVGEKRSDTAQAKGYSWEECQINNKPVLSAIRLFDALNYCGLNPREQVILNLWNDGGELNSIVIERLKDYAEEGRIIIGMGKKVQMVLEESRIPHRKLIHPAARGKIANRSIYREHFREVVLS
ncbi:hypothetical protein A2Z22_03915 [Candidatus Woesebacteria bacterium RBG_16_34_12]|uniref:Uracil-DNA glycosylase-like domain-containing protein n=1 Tax=Candidatus Woesebacteria bacterium RBG_16_34_12 TaxID=1802480 RepID=A0A1F7X7D9_9BACT|nr:MAG: hypothetical protein A2Z22_03915 [Candidatus Woesebacteria bacterium RBG_16_34_12]